MLTRRLPPFRVVYEGEIYYAVFAGVHTVPIEDNPNEVVEVPTIGIVKVEIALRSDTREACYEILVAQCVPLASELPGWFEL